MIATSLYLASLPSDLARRRRRLEPDMPVLLSRVEHQREIVASCCAVARGRGVRAGMTVSQARALLGREAHHEPLDDGLVLRALARLAARAGRFSPRVGVCEPDGLWLDARGCSHLFGGVEAMARRLSRWFTRSGLACRVAVAPCMGAAWALARFGPEGRVAYRRRDLEAVLSPLPAACLRLEGATLEAMAEVGLLTVGSLLRVPRAELARRYGPEAARRLDQALGRAAETFEPVRTRPPLAVGRMFEGPTDRPEAVTLCVRGLLEAACARLERRGAGCRQVLVTLRRSDLGPVELAATASAPTRDAKHWLSLLAPKLERANLGFGVEGVTLEARGLCRLGGMQATRWLDVPAGAGGGGEGVARLIDTLGARLGPGRVLRVRVRASHVPERSFEFGPAHAAGEPGPPREPPPPPLDRPTLLLAEPEPAGVMFLHPEGPIGRLRRSGAGGDGGGGDVGVLSCFGPERIGGEWWRGDGDGGGGGGRDYYRVHTDDGAWLWVYRDLGSGRWFVHGEWA